MRDQEQSLTAHFRDLRKRVLISGATVVITTVIAFSFHQQIIEALMGPVGLGPATGGEAGLISTELTETLGVTMKVSFVAGLVGAFPMVLYQIILFVAPGLTPRERRYLFSFMPGAVLAFAGGTLFAYYILIPRAIDFLIGWGTDLATPQIRISNSVGIVLRLLFWMGVVFETPVVLFFLAKIGIVSPSFLARQRRWAIVVAFILGAMITPTFDPINQTLVALPIIVLYETGVWLAKLARRQRRGDSEQPEPLG